MAECFMSEVLVKTGPVELMGDSDKREIIETLVRVLVDAGRIAEKDVDQVVSGAMEREAIGSTGIGHGIAIPHCRTGIVDEIVCAYGRSEEGVDFDSLDGEPVHSVFLLLTPPDQKDRHLSLMKNFAGQIRKEHFCDFLKQNRTVEGLLDLLVEFESD